MILVGTTPPNEANAQQAHPSKPGYHGAGGGILADLAGLARTQEVLRDDVVVHRDAGGLDARQDLCGEVACGHVADHDIVGHATGEFFGIEDDVP